MMQAAAAWLITLLPLIDFDCEPWEITRAGNEHRKFVPTNAYPTTDGAVLSGTTTGPDGMEIAIKNGKIDGDKISFVVTIDFGGMMFDLNYTGEVGPEVTKLTIDIMGMPMSFEVKKAK